MFFLPFLSACCNFCFLSIKESLFILRNEEIILTRIIKRILNTKIERISIRLSIRLIKFPLFSKRISIRIHSRLSASNCISTGITHNLLTLKRLSFIYKIKSGFCFLNSILNLSYFTRSKTKGILQLSAFSSNLILKLLSSLLPVSSISSKVLLKITIRLNIIRLISSNTRSSINKLLLVTRKNTSSISTFLRRSTNSTTSSETTDFLI